MSFLQLGESFIFFRFQIFGVFLEKFVSLEPPAPHLMGKMTAGSRVQGELSATGGLSSPGDWGLGMSMK